MSDRKLQLPDVLFRAVEFERASINAEEMTCEMAISSEEPYERYYGIEILDHSPGAVDMTRLMDSAPLLYNHREQIGVVTDAKLADGKIRCKVKFSRSQLGQEKWQDVQDGILTKCSVGYRIKEMVLESEKDGVGTYRATKWQPYEATLTPLPADPTVGVGRSEDDPAARTILISAKKILENEKEEAHKRAMPESTAPSVEVLEAERKAGATAFRERSKKINDFANEVKTRRGLDCTPFTEKYIFGEKADASFDDFRAEVLLAMDTLKPVETSPSLGLSKKEQKSFSLLNAIRNISAKRFDGTFEQEVSEAAAKLYKRSVSETTIVLPEDITSYDMMAGERNAEAQMNAFARQLSLFGMRAQNVTTATAGGFTVPTMLGSLIELLRNKTVLGSVGITTISGLQGDMALPVQTGAATAYWVAETGAVTDSEVTFGQKQMTPHRLGGSIPFSTQFIAQSSLPAEQFLRSELMTVSALAVDLAGLLGTGVGGEPLGVANTTGINATVTYGGAATWEDVVQHETGIAVDNAIIGGMAFVLSPASVGKWKTILRSSVAGATYLINDQGTANGYSVFSTNQVNSTNQSFFGVWSQLIHAMWAGMEVIVDPYTLKKSGQVEITMNSMHDFLVRQPLAFNVSTDSAAQ